jgi:hypothetical protein
MENAKVYKITNDLNDKIYIGSSNNQYLSCRMTCHRQMCKDLTGRRNTKLYSYMREIGVEHFHIELIEKFQCETKQQLREREQHHIDILKPELNMFRAIENPNYVKLNREKINKKSNEYYYTNKEKLLKKQKEYAEKNKEAINIRRKKYREENKEKIKLQKDKTRDEYNKRRREKRAQQKKD